MPSSERLAWAVLALLLAALFVRSALFDRSQWPSVVGDEATYLMAAQSLISDFDYAYSRSDFDRFTAGVGASPEGLILLGREAGERLLYGKPWLYPLYISPFVAAMPQRGAAVANALLLGLVALIAARSLRSELGALTPLWLGLLLFGSIAFAHVFWAHADLFLMSLVALAWALVHRSGEASDCAPPTWRPLVAAALLILVIVARPFYAPLVLPAAYIVWRRHGGSALLRFLGAGAATVLLCLALNLVVFGTWSSYAGERLGFYSYTGFPLIDAGVDWRARLGSEGANAWTGDSALPFAFDARRTLWNLVYLFGGRHVGLVPYFLPVMLVLVFAKRNRETLVALAAVAAVVGLFLLARPVNFYGGGAALANRYFLPAYPLFWWMIARLRWPALLLGAILALPFLWPSLTEPDGYLRARDGSYRYVSPLAERLLPYETTQSHLKPSGREDFVHRSLWIKALSPRVRDSGADTIEVSPGNGQGAVVLVGSNSPLEGLRLKAAGGDPQGELLLRPRRRASHAMWWREEPFHLYQLDLDALIEQIGGVAPDQPGAEPVELILEPERRRPDQLSKSGS